MGVFADRMRDISNVIKEVETAPITSSLQSQLDLLNSLRTKIESYDPNVVAGIYGEEARYKRNLGTNLAAAGSDIGGTMNKLPLFSAGAEFAAKRMSARNAVEQARILNLLGIGQGYGEVSKGYRDLYFGQKQLDLQTFQF